MNFERMRFAAEMLGITAVVASLIAVVLELRQTQSALQAATYQARAFQAIEHNTELQDSDYMLPLLARIDMRDVDQLNALSKEDALRLRVFFTSREVDADNEHYQYEQGFLGEEHLQGRLIPHIRSNAPVWRSIGIAEKRPSFRRFVDEVLAESSP